MRRAPVFWKFALFDELILERGDFFVRAKVLRIVRHVCCECAAAEERRFVENRKRLVRENRAGM